MSDPIDLTQFESYYEQLPEEVLDDETAPRVGLRVPPKGATTRTQGVKTSAGVIPSTITTWNEVAELKQLKSGITRQDDPLRAYGAFWAAITLTISRDPLYENTNRGRGVTELLRFYPLLMNLSDEEMKRIGANAPEKSPLRYLKSRKIDNAQAHRLLGALVTACGYGDRLTKGGGLRLPAVADLLANNGVMLTKIPFKVVIEKGRPEYSGAIPEQRLIDFKVL